MPSRINSGFVFFNKRTQLIYRINSINSFLLILIVSFLMYNRDNYSVKLNSCN
jgi:hypothetical protein